MLDEARRLHEIDARRLAQEVCVEVWDAVEFQTKALGRPIKVSDVRETAPLFEAVLSVTDYAQKGGGELPQDDLNLIVKTVFCPPDPHSGLRASDQWNREGEPRTPLETVIYATLARFRTDQGAKVPVAWLAALGGCSVKRLRNLGASGEVAIDGGNVKAVDAWKWLQYRSIAGYEPRYLLSAAAAKLKRTEDYVRRLAHLDGALDPRGPSVTKAWVEKRLAMRVEVAP